MTFKKFVLLFSGGVILSVFMMDLLLRIAAVENIPEVVIEVAATTLLMALISACAAAIHTRAGWKSESRISPTAGAFASGFVVMPALAIGVYVLFLFHL